MCYCTISAMKSPSGNNLQRKSSGSNLQRKSSGSNMQRKTTSFNGGTSTIEKSPSSPTSPAIDGEKKKVQYLMFWKFLIQTSLTFSLMLSQYFQFHSNLFCVACRHAVFLIPTAVVYLQDFSFLVAYFFSIHVCCN